jgi:hypothetical protein
VVSGSCRASVVLAQPQRALYAIGRHRADLRCMSRAGGLVACGAPDQVAKVDSPGPVPPIVRRRPRAFPAEPWSRRLNAVLCKVAALTPSQWAIRKSCRLCAAL